MNNKSTDRTPYTYLIKFIPTGQLYYGSKTAKGCCPDDLWVSYFTSSKYIKELINNHGKESFSIEHVLVHESRALALEFEELVLLDNDAARNPNYLNRHNGGKNFVFVAPKYPISDETRQKISVSSSGRKKSPETLAKITGANSCRFGTSNSPETRKKISQNHADMSGENNPMFGRPSPNLGNVGELSIYAKKYIILYPDGHKEIILGMKHFCRENSLDSSTMFKIAKGVYKQHKGFKCEYYIDGVE